MVATTTSSSRRSSFMMKESPNMDMNSNELQVESQATDVKTRSVRFVGQDPSRIVFIGYSDNRCVAHWKSEPKEYRMEGDDIFTETSRIPLTSNPMDLKAINDEQFAVSTSDGSIIIVDAESDDLVLTRTHKNIHNGGDARVMTVLGDTIFSGSSSGSLACLNIETGAITRLNCDFAGVKSLCTFSGGSLLASGHATGQLLIWDIRDVDSMKKPQVAQPSNRTLDGVTALTSHPAQANLIACGTDDGAVGFCDVRGISSALLPQTFDITKGAVTQISFHPQCGEHMVCSSSDGSLIHWDASLVNSIEYRTALSRNSPWTSEHLPEAIKLNTLRSKSFSGIYGFDIMGRNLVVANDMMSILYYENCDFPVSAM